MVTQRVGSTKLKILSAVAEHNLDDKSPRQKDLVEGTTLTKGAVSNNCTKLTEEGVLQEADGRYTVDHDKILDFYITHLEEYCRREAKQDQEVMDGRIERYNRVRTMAKERLMDLDDREREVLEQILINVLAQARDDPHVQTFRETLLRADMVLQEAGQLLEKVEEGWADTTRMLGSITHRNHDVLASLDIPEEAKEKPMRDDQIVQHMISKANNHDT